LNPDAQLPIKVSPKLLAELEKTRASVKQELAPLLARQDEERRRKAELDRVAAVQRGR
jgi:hypothetical protein